MNSVAIRSKTLSIPLIQGGMGVGVSLGRLAGNVALQGGMGVISSVNSGYDSPEFWKNPLTENLQALKRQIEKAKQIAGKSGMIAANIMVATTNYAKTVKMAIESGIDAIISGAGLPMELPALVKGTDVAAAPIVSSGQAARVICTMWDRKHEYTPDFIVVEGSKAGGHLGFTVEKLLSNTMQTLEEILSDVLKAINPFENKYQKKIPVFVGGGIETGADIARFVKQGASGVQMSTCFIATHECDASEAYKQAIIDAREEDICIIQSPVGMPGRALRSPLVQKLQEIDSLPIERCIKCLVPCDNKTTPYCISKALMQAVEGNWEEGLFFCGAGVGNVNEMRSVEQLMQQLVQEWEAAG